MARIARIVIANIPHHVILSNAATALKKYSSATGIKISISSEKNFSKKKPGQRKIDKYPTPGIKKIKGFPLKFV